MCAVQLPRGGLHSGCFVEVVTQRRDLLREVPLSVASQRVVEDMSLTGGSVEVAKLMARIADPLLMIHAAISKNPASDP